MTLRFDDLHEFTTWAAYLGYRREDTRGQLEVLRLRLPGEDPLRYYAKKGSAVHVVATQGDAADLARRWAEWLEEHPDE